MPISASQIVEVSPQLLKPSGVDLEFNGLLLSESAEIPLDSILAFADPLDVANYFGGTSIEAELANIYFLGFTNSSTKPRILYISRYINNAHGNIESFSAWLRGGEIQITLEHLKTLKNIPLNLEINNKSILLENLDFTATHSFSEAGKIIEMGIQAKDDLSADLAEVTVEYSSLFNAFRINTNSQQPETTSINFCSSELADLLSLTEAKGAVISKGSTSLSEFENMENILVKTQNWVNFTTTWLPSKNEVLGFASWASSKKTSYLYLYSDIDLQLLDANSKSTISYVLREENLSAVAGQYAGVEYSVFLMSVAACIDWNSIQASITSAFKSQEGLKASVQKTSDAANLILQGMNFIGDYATRNDNFVFNYPGQMFGDYHWIDTYWNAIWLNNALQVALMNGLSLSARTPYSEQGYTLIRAWMHEPINRALRNGVIEKGIALSELQKAQINREVGKNVSNEIYSSGYYIQIEDPGAQARENRESPLIKLWYSYGGSVNQLTVSSTAIV